MIKIKWFIYTAERPDGGPWSSDNKAFEDALNVVATPERLRGYYPDPQEGLIELVKEQYKDIEVLEITTSEEEPIPADAIF